MIMMNAVMFGKNQNLKPQIDKSIYGCLKEKMGIQNVKDLKVYNMAFELAMEIFKLTQNFPKEEQYSLTDHMRRSSRSAAINIREGFAKKRYENVFLRHLNDSLGSSEETRGWLDFSVRCRYIDPKVHEALDASYDEVNAMLYSLMRNWKPLK